MSASLLPFSRPSRALRWTAAVCAFAIWALGILAASPDLHGLIHADAGNPNHSCAVTLLSDGVDDVTAQRFSLSAPVLFPIGARVPAVEPILADAPHLLPPGRGPPSA
jgi:hypothetical protein